MKNAEVEIDAYYTAKVSQRITVVQVKARSGKGWNVRNVITGRDIYFRSGGKLRKKIEPEKLQRYLEIYGKK